MFQNYSVNVFIFLIFVINFILSVITDTSLVPYLTQIIRKIRKKEKIND